MICESGGLKKIFFIIIFASVLVVSYVYHSAQIYTDRRSTNWNEKIINLTKFRSRTHSDFAEKFLKTGSTVDVVCNDTFSQVNFDINGSDVLVFLHMQKTGGTTLGRHLVTDIDLVKECSLNSGKEIKRKNCFRPNSDDETWIVSRYSTGWICGLHSDWTELQECVPGKLSKMENNNKPRRFFYITLLRDPVKRFLSEWLHVRRGATWSETLYSCNGTKNRIPHCYSGYDWKGVSFKEFISCRQNMAANRQTRMIADLRTVNCYERWLSSNMTDIDIQRVDNNLLESAKKNLREMTFFGLVEDQIRLQRLFEFTFPLKFKIDFEQFNVTRISAFNPTDEQLQSIQKLNYLDIKLYSYAKKLFDKRFEKSLPVS